MLTISTTALQRRDGILDGRCDPADGSRFHALQENVEEGTVVGRSRLVNIPVFARSEKKGEK